MTEPSSAWDDEPRIKLTDKFVHRAWPGLVSAVVGIAVLAGALTIGSSEDPQSDGRDLNAWGALLVVVGILALVLGLFALGEWSERRRFRSGDRRAAIQRLTKSLEQSLTAIEAIRTDVATGQEMLADLEKRAEVHQRLAQLSESEAQAVRAVLEEGFRIERRSSLKRDVILGLVFFALGIGASVLLGL